MTVAIQHPRLNIETIPARQVEIPLTTRERYITGVYALNIEPPEGTTGDWHDVFHWRDGLDDPVELMLGGTEEVNTNHIYGDLGVYEGRDRVLRKRLSRAPGVSEVFIANHYRAILDMLFHSLTQYGRVYNLNGATVDWLDTPEQQHYVLEQATRMAPHLTEPAQAMLTAWIEGELARA